MRGELPTGEGWARAWRGFLNKNDMPQKSVLRVVCNYFGVNYGSVKDDSARVDMEFTDLAQIEANLRYTPPMPTKACN